MGGDRAQGTPGEFAWQPWMWWPAAWLLFNLVQAGLTPLDPDEAYYWMYADRLSWGYYDHPPAVGLLIRLGIGWLPGELGLRFGNVLVSTLTLLTIWLLAERPRGRAAVGLFLLLASMPFLQIYGFIATPDGPLLLSATAFWLAYRSFCRQPNAGTAVLLGLAMAALLYSKYHGILVIGFTVLSNFRLWRNGWFYLAGIAGVLLFLPHLYWQYAHDFPSFRYHLAGRDDIYELKHTLNYLVNQLVGFNPLLLPFWAPLLWQKPVSEPLYRAFRFNLIGFWVFFLWSTSKGHTEPQWTAVLSIPLALILWQEWSKTALTQSWVWRLAAGSVMLFALLRLALAWPGATPLRQMRNLDWIEALAVQAGNRAVVFENSYRDASLYRFYANKPAWNITNVNYRRSQYDLWTDETDLHQRPVLFAGQPGWLCPHPCDTLAVGRLRKNLLGVDRFVAFQQVFIEFPTTPSSTQQISPGDTLHWEVAIHHRYPFALEPTATDFPLQLFVLASSGVDQWRYWPTYAGAPTVLPVGDTVAVTVSWVLPADFPRGHAQLGLGWAYAGLPPALQSPLRTVQIAE